MKRAVFGAVGVGALLAAGAASAQDAAGGGGGDAALAQQLTNPVANLISVPLQHNFDFGGGPDDSAFRYLLNVQPVIPVQMTAKANLISRTILPIVHQSGLTAPGEGQTGLGDVVQSVFFSPKDPTASGIVWGAGPVLLVPTATDRALGSGKFGMGPTAVVLRLDGQWTYGVLINHIWSVAGKADRADVSATFVQPFLTYTTRKATTYSLNAETSHDWISGRSLVPINIAVTQLVKISGQPVSLGGGVRVFAVSPKGGPNWGLRLSMTFLFPAG
mgnify:CR=1 FL=1